MAKTFNQARDNQLLYSLGLLLYIAARYNINGLLQPTQHTRNDAGKSFFKRRRVAH